MLTSEPHCLHLDSFFPQSLDMQAICLKFPWYKVSLAFLLKEINENSIWISKLHLCNKSEMKHSPMP